MSDEKRVSDASASGVTKNLGVETKRMEDENYG